MGSEMCIRDRKWSQGLVHGCTQGISTSGVMSAGRDTFPLAVPNDLWINVWFCSRGEIAVVSWYSREMLCMRGPASAISTSISREGTFAKVKAWTSQGLWWGSAWLYFSAQLGWSNISVSGRKTGCISTATKSGQTTIKHNMSKSGSKRPDIRIVPVILVA